MPEADAMFTMAPPPCFSITGSTYLQPRNTLFRLWFTCASKTSSDISTGPPGAEPPTLFTRMSMRPKRFTHASTIAATALPSVTSHECVAMPGALATVSSMLLASRSTAKTLAPSSTNRMVVARPLPQPGPTEPAPGMGATLPLSREAIEPPRVVDQHCFELPVGRCGFRKRVDEVAVVRHLGKVRMRPVGAPQRAIAELGNQLALERTRVPPRRTLLGDPLGPAHLDPDMLVLHEREERLELRTIEASRRVDATHVVDHHRHRRAGERRRELRNARPVHVDLQVPADFGEALRHAEHRIDAVALAEVAHEVEAHAAEALGIELLQLRARRGGGQQGDAAVVAVRGEEIGGGRVVELVHGRLHDHSALDAQVVVKREERFLRPIGWRCVPAVRGDRETAARAEDVEMGVARAAGQLEARLSRIRLEGGRRLGHDARRFY